jgi:ABC-type hemin transport system substrate-binding protein
MAYPCRIVCLSEETTETLYLLGEQHRIVGISGYTVRPPQAVGQWRSACARATGSRAAPALRAAS